MHPLQNYIIILGYNYLKLHQASENLLFMYISD